MSNRSTGPRSAEGKAASSRNALKSGIYAKGEVILDHEDPKDLEALTDKYYQQFAPSTPQERCLVDSLISDEWLLRRFRIIEAQIFIRLITTTVHLDDDNPIGDTYERRDRVLERLQRRVNAVRRNYNKTFEILTKLQPPVPQPVPEPKPVQPAATPTQFVPSTQSGPPSPRGAIGFVHPVLMPEPGSQSAIRGKIASRG